MYGPQVAKLPTDIPAPHRAFLQRLSRLSSDERIDGVAIGGSLASSCMDEFSDLDVVVVLRPERYESVMRERRALAASLGPLLGAFTGEHVGEPRLLICLYDDPLLHVDLKFVALDAFSRRVEDPVVLWEREGRLTETMQRTSFSYPAPDRTWIAERFWIWIHYAATKIARGELFEAIDFLGFLRFRVLGPLGLQHAGGRPNGVRKLEATCPAFADTLRGTLARYDARDCLRAVRASIDVYMELRGPTVLSPEEATRTQVLRYLDSIEPRLAAPADSSEQAPPLE